MLSGLFVDLAIIRQMVTQHLGGERLENVVIIQALLLINPK